MDPKTHDKIMRQLGLRQTPNFSARFYDHETCDVTASRQAQQRIMKTVLMIELKPLGQGGYQHSRLAKDADRHDYPDAWMAYQQEHAHGAVQTDRDQNVRTQRENHGVGGGGHAPTVPVLTPGQSEAEWDWEAQLTPKGWSHH